MINLLKKYKYPIIIAILISWLLVFAQYDVFTVFNQRRELKEGREKKVYLKKEIERINTEREKLETDPKEVERQSRERYFMKKDNEDVFIYDTVVTSVVK